ncbi:MAG: hypothetical protein ABIX28_23460 [Vicinamibacterales bacterium]
MNLVDEIGPGITSLEYVRAQLRLDRPVSVKNLLARYREPVMFDEPLITPDGVALGGHHVIRLERNGHFSHKGRMEATGFPSFRYGVRTVMGGRSGAPWYVATVTGEVHGSNELGHDVSTWDEGGEDNGVKLYWAALKGGEHTTDVSFESDFFGTFGDVAGFIASLAGGFFFAGSVGVCFVLGGHTADAFGLDEATGTAGLAGVVVAGGVLVVFGAGAIIPAIVAGVAAGVAVELTLKHRRLTDRPHEVAFADRVFRGTLPLHRIVLTNMVGMGKRPFTVPSFGDTILVNLGAGFDDPTRYTGFGDPDNPNTQAAGQLFIHELVHAWQIDATFFMPGLMCGALLNQATTIGGDMSVYDFSHADRPFGRFNLEQQAAIVDQWFSRLPKAGGTPPTEGEADEYFRYIRDNIRRRLP